MGIFGKDKEEKQSPNKFEGKRQYIQKGPRAFLPQKTLKRLDDLYELLHCDPDADGYVITTFKEMNELTEMDVNLMTIMIHNGMIRKANTGSSPKFKYKWDTIKPSMDMATKLLGKKLDMKTAKSSEESADVSSDVEEKPELQVLDEPTEDFVSLIDYQRNGDMMTIRLNMSKFEVEESAIINAIMQLLIK